MSTPSDPPTSTEPQHWVRPAVTADAPVIDAWLMARMPLPVPEARARRLSLEALLEQGAHGMCLIGGTNMEPDMIECLLPVTLVHSLFNGGRIAMAAEWWPPDAADAPVGVWLAECCAMLADWCRAHGIRHLCLTPAIVGESAPPAGFFQCTADGLWHHSLAPAPKQLG